MTRADCFRTVALLVPLLVQTVAAAEQSDQARIVKVESGLWDVRAQVRNLDAEVRHLRSDIRDTASSGAVLFLFGAVCALWAQNTGRNPWLWFVLGLAFSVISALVMLYKNAQDRKSPPKMPGRSFSQA